MNTINTNHIMTIKDTEINCVGITAIYAYLSKDQQNRIELLLLDIKTSDFIHKLHL